MEMDKKLIRKIDKVHPYPAKFPVDLAINYISKYASDNGTVFDPFLGSGTTLLAARLMNRFGYGTDINHIAILISSFKQLRLTIEDILELQTFIEQFEKKSAEIIEKTKLFNYPSIEHWFCKNAIAVLSAIKYEIKNLKNFEQQQFANLVFSAIINTVSNQESDTRYAAINKPNMTIEHLTDIFVNKFNSILEMFITFNNEYTSNKRVQIYLQDAKECDKIIPLNSVDLILTSPPYPNTYDYYLYHKHRMNWLEYDVKFSMEKEIGSRREYSSLKKSQNKFDNDLYEIFTACNKTLKDNGHVVIVMGDGRIQGEKYDAKLHIEEIGKKLKWRLIDYSYTSLDETSRSFQQSYRTKGKKEHILTFKKERTNEN